jgi:hypothetical protein
MKKQKLKCSMCHEKLPKKSFARSGRDGHQSSCKNCLKKYKIEYRKKLKKDPKARILHNMMKNSRSRAKKLNLPFDLSKKFLNSIFQTYCPVFGIPFYMEPQEQGDPANPFTPSIDRVDNNKGYIRTNVRIICFRANRLKSNATVEELENVIAYIKREIIL